jgi:RNA polymerase sigma-70 factor (ECF subfamily)
VEAWGGPGAFADVLDAARTGDERAFSALWRWLNPALMRWLAVTVPDGRDDVASEVWMSIVRALDIFEGDERKFRGWVFTMARRRAIDWGRRRRRHRDAPLPDGVDPPSPSDASEAVSEATAVEAAIALLRQLKPDQAEVVALRVIAGLTVGETAAVVDKSEGAVRVLCHRGLRALERHVTPDVRQRV